MLKKETAKKIIVFLIISLLVSVAFAGCSNEDSKESNKGSVDTGSSDYKSEVVVGIAEKLTNTNPQSMYNVHHKRLYLLTHNTLIQYDSKSKELVPMLAESWKISDDLKTYEMKLRQNVKFHNGAVLTAEDVKFTFEYGKENADSQVKRMMENIDHIDVINDNTVNIVLVEPNVDFGYILAEPGLGILCKDAVENDLENAKIGTGVWQHYEFVDSDYVKLKRFDDYWGEKPVSEYLTLKTIPEASARAIALENGEIDVCLDPSTSDYSFLVDDDNIDLVKYDGTQLQYLAFNITKSPGNNEKFRQACAYALNYDDIIDGAYDGYGKKAVTNWCWNQNGYAGNEIEGYNYNIEKAKELLKESGYGDGATIDIMSTGKQRVKATEIIQSQLKEIGIKVNVVEVDSAGFSAKTTDGGHQACVYAISYAIYGDDACRTYAKGSTANKSFQDNPKIEELMAAAKVEKDDEKRNEIYKEWQQLGNDECAVIPLLYNQGALGKLKNAEGIVVDSGGIHNFTYLKVKK